MTRICYVFALMGLLAIFYGCVDDLNGTLSDNSPPQTRLFVETTDPLNPTQSSQTFYWDGTDDDGFITGFFYTFHPQPTENDWTWTTERSETFLLSLTGSDTVYTFQVKAVDNQGAEDPTPAYQEFPILNSPPDVQWGVGSDLPDSIFTIANFAWSATDPDGDSTIASFEYALDDTAVWDTLPGDRRSLVLREQDGLTPGAHALYLRAVDVAGARSPIIRLPENPADFWVVRAPVGRYLLIDDYLVESTTSGFPDRHYRNLLDSLLGANGEQYTYWNIEEQFPSSVRQFAETIKLFDRVIWYTDLVDQTDEKFIAAQIALPEFRQNGGKLIYTVQFNTGFGSQGEPLAFSPVEALGRNFNILSGGSQYRPDSVFATTFPSLPPLPELELSAFVFGMIALQPKVTSVPMYRYDDPNTTEDPLFILAGRNDNSGEYDFVFSGTPLHFLDGNGNVNRLISIIVEDLFGP